MPKRRKTIHESISKNNSFTEIIDLTDKINIENESFDLTDEIEIENETVDLKDDDVKIIENETVDLEDDEIEIKNETVDLKDDEINIIENETVDLKDEVKIKNEIVDLTDEFKIKNETVQVKNEIVDLTNEVKTETVVDLTDKIKIKTESSYSSPSGSRGKKRPWSKEEDQALLDSIIIELTGRWSSICSRNELLIQRGTSMVSQRFKNSIKNKLVNNGENFLEIEKRRVKED